ncbi:YlbL family protein [Georgenia wangjunii]|uniref:YlbL family protein n=1 Tax=Georgenia wangjunii TaxID=3117730 RepID=UPI002F269D17
MATVDISTGTVPGTDLPEPEPASSVSPRVVTAAIAGAVTFVLVLAMMLVPAPYAIQSPGPTVDTLSQVDGSPMIAVEGAQTYPTEGQLRLTTVAVVGGPGFPASVGDVLRGWLSSSRRVTPREAMFAPEQSRQEVREQSSAEMTSSQTNASVAALSELGYEVPAVLDIADVPAGGAAEGIVAEGDVLRWITADDGERVDVTSFGALADVLAQTPPGTTVTLGVLRSGEELALDVVTGDDGSGGSLLGVLIAPDVDLPVDIEIAIEDVGGPSAGLMFALGIVDVLTPGAMTGGEVVAGTGTITIDGDVGPIGGIEQKLAGARRDGATWFLAPQDNCASVVGHVPDGLDVVAVSTLAEGRAAVEAIAAGDGASLPGCSAADG